MTRQFRDDDDSLMAGRTEEFREAFDLPEASAALRQDLLARTVDGVRKRRVRRFIGPAVLVGAAYVLGFVTSPLFGAWSGAPAAPTNPAGGNVERMANEVSDDGPDPEPIAVTRELLADTERLTLLLDGLPLDARVRVLKKAGDMYLHELDDIPAATACYRRFLDLKPAVDSLDSENDSWLLHALKLARVEERIDDDKQI